MTKFRLAVIDLGSNTFHLLIADILPDGTWSVFIKDRRYVKLASGGLEEIDQASIARAIKVIKEFSDHIARQEVDRIRAIGTSAMREAHNGAEVARQMQEVSGIPVEIIDGQEEARYILLGIRSALPMMKEPCLIMDIGGGSVEFILYHGKELLYAESFKIGVAVLYQTFHHQDPIHPLEIKSIEQHLDDLLQPLFEALDKVETYSLVGASGSFEVIRDAMPKKEISGNWAELDFKSILPYLEEVIHADLGERKLREEIPPERLDYIVVAYILIRYLLKKRAPSRLFYCDFALKEGVIAEEISKNLD